MSNLITPPFGNTPQSIANNNLWKALGSITGMPPQAVGPMQQAVQMQANAPQFQQQVTQAQQQQAGLPEQGQNYSNEANLLAMFAHDQNLSQQYTRPDMQVLGANTQQPSDVPTAPGAPVPQTPVLTLQSLLAPFTGFTTPGAVNTAISNQGNQFGSALDLISKAIQFNSGQVATNVGSNTSNYAASTNALMSLANLLGSASSSSSLGIGSAGYNLLMAQQAQQDASKGMTLRDLVKKYTGVLDPNAVFNIYSQYNYGANPSDLFKFQSGKGGYGLPKESAQDLAGLGITGPAISTTTKATSAQGALSLRPGLFNTPTGVYWKPKSGVEMQINLDNSGKMTLVSPDGNQTQALLPNDPEVQAAISAGWTPLQQ